MAQQTDVLKVIATTSKQWLLNKRDFLHGLYMAVIGAVLSPILGWVESQFTTPLHYSLNDMWHAAAYAALTYLVRNWIKPSQTIIQVQPPIKKLNDDSGEIPPIPPPIK